VGRYSWMRAAGQARRWDWDAIGGIVAALVALVLHLLHVIETDVVLAITLVVLALLLFRDLRREAQDEQILESSVRSEKTLEGMRQALQAPDVILLGPRELRPASEAFARNATGEMIWFNVCLLMFRPQPLFDSLLRPALENRRVTSIQFVLDPSEHDRWTSEVLAKAEATGTVDKLREPRWVPLNQEAISFILSDSADGGQEAHLSFWGEPFMSRQQGFEVPRYVLHVQSHSELLDRLIDLERGSRHKA